MTLADVAESVFISDVRYTKISGGTHPRLIVYFKIHNTSKNSMLLESIDVNNTGLKCNIAQSYVDDKGIGHHVFIDRMVVPPESIIELHEGGLHVMISSIPKENNIALDLKFSNQSIVSFVVNINQ